jgi:hypothetical protein
MKRIHEVYSGLVLICVACAISAQWNNMDMSKYYYDIV